MRTLAVLLAVLLAGLLVACASSGPVLRSDVNPEADFARFETFSFLDPLGTEASGTPGYESLLTQRIKRALRIELEACGYRYRHAGGDLLVNAFLNVEERKDLRTIPTVGPDGYYGYRTGRYRPWPTHYETRVVRYKAGTLSIDLVDADRKLLVWNGTAEGSLRDLNLAEPSDETVRAAVARIFRLYPYRAGHAEAVGTLPAE